MSRRRESGDIQCPIITSTSDLERNYHFYFTRYHPGRRRYHSAFMNQRLRDARYPMPIFLGHNPQNQVRPHPAVMTAEPLQGPVTSTRFALLAVIGIFLCSILALSYVYTYFPQLEPHEKQYMKIPWDIEDAKNLGKVLDRYKEKYFFEVLSGVCLVYIFLQTFAIPGSLFLSILSGFLFPFIVALILVCSCSAVGASLCYLLSQLLGRRIVNSYFPDRARAWSKTVDRHKDNLLNYMLFLRITPFVPNWFINLTAPVVGVSLYPFVLGTFLGVAPPSFVAIQAGQTLHKMTSSNDAFSWMSILLLSVFAVISMVPVLFRNRMKNKFD